MLRPKTRTTRTNAYYAEITPLDGGQVVPSESHISENKDDGKDDDDDDDDELAMNRPNEEEIRIDEVPTYSSASETETEPESDDDITEIEGHYTMDEVGHESTFMIGSSSRYGRRVRLTTKFTF